ncbi:MAG: glycosyltransferase family 2 protein [Candidatus Microsaccharimonas sp.]
MLEVMLYILYAVLLIVAAGMVRQLAFAMKHFIPPVYTRELGKEVDMPSVTVCIPARNEMHALTECLESVIASDYDRLEIIVLDDVSGDDTSDLIKSYAHEGVRFVEGKALPAGWLGKNHALQGLLQHASGTYILYMDVDTRIAPNAVSNMVRYALSQRAAMVSVLPRREDGWRASVVFSPLRYFWEVIFHRKQSPATASSAWLIQRKVLTERFNGFSDLKAAIQPESKLSAALSVTHEYRFLMSTQLFGVAYEKKWRSQLSTSTRLLFPLLHYQVSLAITALIDLLAMIIPAVIVAGSFFVVADWVHIMAVLISILFASIYGWYAKRVWSKGALLGSLLWPYLLLQEAVLVVASIVQYKRGSVEWKGRKINLVAKD